MDGLVGFTSSDWSQVCCQLPLVSFQHLPHVIKGLSHKFIKSEKVSFHINSNPHLPIFFVFFHIGSITICVMECVIFMIQNDDYRQFACFTC